MKRYTHLLGFVEGKSGEWVAIDLTYTLPIPRLTVRNEFDIDERPRRKVLDVTRRVLRWMGLLPWSVQLSEPNADHYESVHVVVHRPGQASLEDIYWERVRKEGEPSSLLLHESRYQRGPTAWLSMRHDELAQVNDTPNCDSASQERRNGSHVLG